MHVQRWKALNSHQMTGSHQTRLQNKDQNARHKEGHAGQEWEYHPGEHLAPVEWPA